MAMVEALPSTWDLDTIRKVRRLFSEGHVDKALIAKHGDYVLEATRGRLARHFVEQARALAVEAHLGDVRFVVDETDSIPFTVRVRVHWSPDTNAVELRGGAVDGQVFAVQRVGDPLVIPVERPFTLSEAKSPADFAPHFDRLTYELAGWAERERRWVYALRH